MKTRNPASGLSSRTRRRAALIAVLALPISLMTAPTHAEVPTPSSGPPTPEAAPSTPTKTALAEAKKSNKRVEIEGLRSETGTFYANPDGKTVHAELSSTPIRVKKEGAWQAIDLTLIEKDGVLQPKAAKGNLVLSQGGDTTAIKFTGDNGQAAISAPTKLSKPVVKGNTAQYPAAYGPGIDLVIVATATGFRHEIVIRQRPAKDIKLRVPVRLPQGIKLGNGPDKTPGVLDSKGKELADLAAAPMLDAAALRNPDQGIVTQAPAAIEHTSDGDSVVLTAKSKVLNDPAITYPVTLAVPSQTWEGTGIADDTHVSTVLPSGSANAGLDWLLAGRSHGGTRTHRSYIRFNIHDTPLMGGHVNDADLRLFNQDSDQCDDNASPGIVALRIIGDWTTSSLTLDNQPSITFSGQDGETGAYSATRCPEGEGELWHDIDPMVQAWMDGEPDNGVQLRSASDTVPTNWRYYRSNEYGGYDTYPFTPRGPVLFIEYEPAPPAPKEMILFEETVPNRTKLPTYEEAAATQITTTDGVIDAPTVTLDQVRELREKGENRIEVGPDRLQPLEGEEWTNLDDPDSKAPIVTGMIEPGRDATNVPTSTTVKVTFNEPVTGVQVTVKDPSDAAVQGTLAGANDNFSWTFTPTSPLAAQRAYRVEVTNGKDRWGNVMEPYTWSFTTGADTPQPIPGLVASYGMNEGSGTNVADFSGQNNPGTSSATSWANGKYGKALSFNGSSSMVTVAHAASLRLTTGMTLSAWVNPTTVTGTPWKSVVTKELTGEGASYALYAANGEAVPSGWVQTAEASSTAGGISPLPVNSWSHLALTYDGATLRLFVNGQQVSQTALNASLYDDGSPLRIGGNTVWREYFSGLIDEVRIYNRAQTATQIQTDMNTPIGERPQPDTQAPTAPGSLAATGGPGNAQLTWTASTDNVGVNGYTIHRSTTPGFTPSAANQVGSSPTTTFTDAGLAAGTYYYRVRATDAAGNLSPSSNEVSATLTAPPTNPGLVAAYGMEEGTGTTVGDSSGKNNTGAATDTTWANGKHGKALSFNGTSSWVTIPHAPSLRLTNTLTLSAWVRPSVMDTLWRPVLLKERSTGGGYGLYASTEYNAPAGWLETTEESAGLRGHDPLPLNQWSHLATTYDGSTMRLYINGVQISQASFAGDVLDDGGSLRIGGNTSFAEYFSGLIDEVRIYNRAQTATQIQTDMNTPIGAAARSGTAPQLRTSSAEDLAPTIEKLTVNDSRTVNGVTVASTLTPHLTTWLSAKRSGEAKVDVEVAHKPVKSDRANKVDENKRLIWSGQTTAKANDSRVTLDVPKDRLRGGEKVRWRARVTDSASTGAWTDWHDLTIDTSKKAPRTTAATAAATDFFDRVDLNKCATGSFDGAVVNQYNWCRRLNTGGLVFTKVGGVKVPTGYVNFKAYAVINTHAGNQNNHQAKDDPSIDSRSIDLKIRISEPWTMGEVGNLTMEVASPAKGDPSSCTQTYLSGPTERSIPGWVNNPELHFRFYSSEVGSAAGDATSACTLSPQITVDNGESDETFPVHAEGYEPKMHCDSSSMIYNYWGGCVMAEATNILTYYRMGDHAQVAEHIYKAFTAPNSTLPTVSARDKLIPGNADAPRGLPQGQPLHRYAKTDLFWEDNLTLKDATCATPAVQATWAADKTDCDEFPFNATREGTASLTWDYSVVYINKTQNRRGGELLSLFMAYGRILHEDPFWVRIRSGSPPAR